MPSLQDCRNLFGGRPRGVGGKRYIAQLGSSRLAAMRRGRLHTSRAALRIAEYGPNQLRPSSIPKSFIAVPYTPSGASHSAPHKPGTRLLQRQNGRVQLLEHRLHYRLLFHLTSPFQITTPYPFAHTTTPEASPIHTQDHVPGTLQHPRSNPVPRHSVGGRQEFEPTTLPWLYHPKMEP